MKTKLVISEKRAELRVDDKYIAAAWGSSEVVWTDIRNARYMVYVREHGWQPHAIFHVDAVEGVNNGS